MKKMVIVGAEELERLREKRIRDYNPRLHSMGQLEEDMEEVLNNSSLPAERKMQLYQALQHRFKSLGATAPQPLPAVGAVANPPAPAAAEANPPAPAAAVANVPGPEPLQPVPPPSLSEMLAPIPISRTKIAAQLLDLIGSRPDIISFNQNRELVLDGQRIPNSDFHDLFTSLYSARKDLNKNALPVFLERLQQLKVPAYLVSDSKARRFLAGATKKEEGQAGQGLKPPGKRVRILRLYR